MAKYEIVTIGDSNSCNACNRMNGRQFEESDLPDMSEVCEGGDRCRCTAVPVDWMDDPEIDKLLEEVAEQMMEGVVFDQKSGKRIILKYFEDVKGLGTLSYSVLSNYETLVARYNREVGRLPKEWYALKDINKQIAFLEKELG